MLDTALKYKPKAVCLAYMVVLPAFNILSLFPSSDTLAIEVSPIV